MRSIIFSALLLSACAVIPRPDAFVCINNVPAKHKKCYNMLHDYDDTGKLRPGAKATFFPLDSLADVNKDFDVSPADLAKLKAYLGKLKDEYQRRCQPQ